jgi:hypothetical protein
MNEIAIIESVYSEATHPVAELEKLTIDLHKWYLLFPNNNYLQPCVIDGKAALVCQKQLSTLAAEAYQALTAICQAYGIYLKEDAREKSLYPDSVHCRRRVAVVLTFCMGLMMASELVNANEKAHSTDTTIGQTQAITQVIKNQPLSHVAQKITAQSGIAFKFNAAVQDDLINKNLVAHDWNSALVQLLQGYNYTTIQQHNQITTVFITGYEGGVKPVANTETSEQTQVNLAADAQDLMDSGNPDSALDGRISMDIDIPTDQLAELAEGGELVVDLPVGAFNIKQENMVDSEDGTLSWVGTMEGANNIYRLYLAKTQEGDVVGNVYTPEGAYNIETINGQTVLIEIDQVSMR